MTIDAALQVLVVGSGASLGREGAPRQFASALGDLGTSRWSLTERDREILPSCAAGAGLAAVYSVPIGGALFATAIILKTWHPRAVGTALITSSLAVAVASPVTHEATPLDWPDPQLSYLLTGFALVLAPLALGVGTGFNYLMARARPAALMKSWILIPSIAAAGLLIGLCSIRYPELPGNGKSILTISLNSGLTLAPPSYCCSSNRFSPQCFCGQAQSAACLPPRSRQARRWDLLWRWRSIRGPNTTSACPPYR